MTASEDDAEVLSAAGFTPAPDRAPAAMVSEWIAAGPDDDESLVRAWLMQFPSRDTRENYLRDITRFRDWLTHSRIPLLGADRVHLDAYARLLDATVRAERSRQRYLSSISSFYKYLASVDKRPSNPMAYVSRPRTPDPNTRHLAIEEALSLLGAIDADPDPLRRAKYAVIVRFMLHLCLRVSEVCNLDRTDRRIIGGTDHITVRRKGGRTSTEPLTGPLIALLDDWERVSASAALVLAGQAGGDLLTPMFLLDEPRNGPRRKSAGPRITRNAIRTRLALYAADARLRDPAGVTPHVIRHTGLTIAADLPGVGVHRLVELARHRDPALTIRTYVHTGGPDGHAGHAIAARLG